ncbi:hypothetical protein Tco_0823383 [Tanacetum coccineum]|uniref:Uncharacterized protein n=1 Tax=Tanacetum coccineum TaxID=301880 RepID=A0ABQ5AMQ8_9ASTR
MRWQRASPCSTRRYDMWENRSSSTSDPRLFTMVVIENGIHGYLFLLQHQNLYVDAQSMFVAIKARFGGNDATKKTQKALLKQQYENFNAYDSSESLDLSSDKAEDEIQCQHGLMVHSQKILSQITDKSKKGFGYNAVPTPHPLILNRPTPLDLPYSGLEEFKQPD